MEDEKAKSEEIKGLLEAQCGATVSVAHSRGSALRALECDVDLDLIVCDLRIPTRDGALDVSEEHGRKVHDAAIERHAGTFSRFFSGFALLENVGEPLANGPSEDVFGTGELWALVHSIPKHKQPELIEWASKLNETIQDVQEVAIRESGQAFANDYQVRTVQIYASRLGGTRVQTLPLGGLSSATVLEVEIFNDSSAPIGHVVAKVDHLNSIKDELERYGSCVPHLLSPGAFAPLAGKVLYGCGRFGAAFYSLASEGYMDLFDFATTHQHGYGEVINLLRASQGQWRSGSATSSCLVRDLRQDRISDSDFEPWISTLGRERVTAAEANQVDLGYSIQHGDLHGLNVLVNGEGHPLIIDYGTLDWHPAALDAVTLELSYVFHEQHPSLGSWPSVEQASSWFDLDRYSADSPVAEIVHSCREWAESVASKRDLAAIVFAHAARQLKYPDTTKSLALAVAQAAMTVLVDE